MKKRIKNVSAFQIFDSRGRPTVECHVTLQDGATGAGLVPSGASTGTFEATELRDEDDPRFGGSAVFGAIDNVEKEIAPTLIGQDAAEQRSIDQRMIELDGTEDKSRLGANAILAVSMATANAVANSRGIPLYESLSNGGGDLLPLPQIQLFGGGAHSAWRTDLQDFLIVPLGTDSYRECLEITHDVYHAAGGWMEENKKSFGVADEGGYWPDFDNHEQILQACTACIERAGYVPGRQVAIALDVAASEFFDGRQYRLNLEGIHLDSSRLEALLTRWCADYPILSIEDPMADSDPEGWKSTTDSLGHNIQIVGDDLFTTNPRRISDGIDQGLANSVLIKLNQIGTVSETMDAIRLTQSAGWFPIVSARSGETEDAFICHLAVASNAGQIKVGSFSRGERMSKWNELLRIERSLNGKSRFIGGGVFQIGPKALKNRFFNEKIT